MFYKCNLTQGLLKKSKLYQHSCEEGQPSLDISPIRIPTIEAEVLHYYSVQFRLCGSASLFVT
jgi:hypothetical protein